jgi:hypothetical protein
MTGYDAATFLADGKHMISNLAMVMEVLMISAVVVGLIVVCCCFVFGPRWPAGWRSLACY